MQIKINWKFIGAHWEHILAAGASVALAWYIMLLSVPAVGSTNGGAAVLLMPVLIAWLLSGYLVGRATAFTFMLLDAVLVIGIAGAAGVALSVLDGSLLGKALVIFAIVLIILVCSLVMTSFIKLMQWGVNKANLRAVDRMLQRLKALGLNWADDYEVHGDAESGLYQLWDKHELRYVMRSGESVIAEWDTAAEAMLVIERLVLKRHKPELYAAQRKATVIVVGVVGLVFIVSATLFIVGFANLMRPA